jgi:hypothetical protein
MMRSALSLTALLILSTSLSAQSNSPNDSKAAVTSQGCPINFAVKRPSGLVARNARDTHDAAAGEGLDLSFVSRTTPDVAAATVTVHGLSEGGGVMPIQVQPREVSEVFHLTRHPGSPGLSTSEIWTKAVVFVSWAEVTEIRYVDGTEWHPSKSSACRAEPSMLLLTGLQ